MKLKEVLVGLEKSAVLLSLLGGFKRIISLRNIRNDLRIAARLAVSKTYEIIFGISKCCMQRQLLFISGMYKLSMIS